MRGEQVTPGEEPEEQEVTRSHAQFVEVRAREPDAGGARILAHDRFDAHPVPPRVSSRQDEPPGENSGCGPQVEKEPDRAVDWAGDEMGSGAQLVQEGDEDRDIGREVKPVPDLVGEPCPQKARTAEPDGDERDGADKCEKHVRVVLQDRDQLGPRHRTVEQFAADDHGHDVGDDEQHHGRAEGSVPEHELVEPDRPLEPGNPGDEQHLRAHQVGRDHSAQFAERRGEGGRRGGGGRRHARPPHPEDDHAAGHQDDPHDARMAALLARARSANADAARGRDRAHVRAPIRCGLLKGPLHRSSQPVSSRILDRPPVRLHVSLGIPKDAPSPPDRSSPSRAGQRSKRRRRSGSPSPVCAQRSRPRRLPRRRATRRGRSTSRRHAPAIS